jgi:SAM-dependent methyltransferase
MNRLSPESDPLGCAVTDYLHTSLSKNILVSSDIAEDDVIPSSYLFREHAEMPALEKIALEQCRGKVLDAGAAAGCHALELQRAGLDVTALDISGLCCQAMKERGVRNVVHDDLFEYDGPEYDTLLLLMNGIGIAGTLRGLGQLLDRSFRLLSAGGRIIFDSSDIDYLFSEEDGSKWINLNTPYYGELNYRMQFQQVTGDEFPWLFIDFKTLADMAPGHGFEAKLLARGGHYDYLGILSKI